MRKKQEKKQQQGAWYGLFAPRRMARCGNTQLHGRQPSVTHSPARWQTALHVRGRHDVRSHAHQRVHAVKVILHHHLWKHVHAVAEGAEHLQATKDNTSKREFISQSLCARGSSFLLYEGLIPQASQQHMVSPSTR